MTTETAGERNIITDKVVVAKTGRTMAEWFAYLDDNGAKSLDHVAIFNLIAGTDGLKPLGEWNHNLLATSYEWDRGLKGRGQKADGFEVGVSKTVSVAVNELYAALVDETLRDSWLPGENITITKSTENKSVRALWTDGKTRLSIDFYPKADAKSQIVVQHLKIPDAEMAARMKENWGRVLSELKSLLEG